MKVRYTCSDSILAMVRDYIVLSVPDGPDVYSSPIYSSETWEKVKRTFARRHHTKSSYVSITAVEHLTEK